MQLETRIQNSLRDIPRDAWTACFPHELEGYDYLLATEDAKLHGFRWCYITAYRDNTLIAAAPAFLTDYAIDTTLEGTGKKIASIVSARFPNLLKLKLACLGSPVTEYGQIGFHTSVAKNEKQELFSKLCETFETHAFKTGHRLIGLKDMTAEHAPSAKSGYRHVAGLPLATLPITFQTIDDYFATLSAATRKDMRRKLKAREQLCIEHRTNIDDALPAMLHLYRATRERAEMQLEELNAAFFTGVLKNVEGTFCTLYWAGSELVAFNLLLQKENTLLDKFFCMDVRGRDFNLYFISWFENIAYCLKHGLTCYQSGAAGYENKLRLGSKLTTTRMYFKHKNRLVQGALRIVARFHSAEPQIVKEAA